MDERQTVLTSGRALLRLVVGIDDMPAQTVSDSLQQKLGSTFLCSCLIVGHDDKHSSELCIWDMTDGFRSRLVFYDIPDLEII